MPKHRYACPALCRDGAHAYIRADGERRYCGRWDQVTDRPEPDAVARYDALMRGWLANGRCDLAATRLGVGGAVWTTGTTI